jgi:hypothetical protein
LCAPTFSCRAINSRKPAEVPRRARASNLIGIILGRDDQEA